MSEADQNAIREILSHMPITVEAHASAEGEDANNMVLTQRRADVIRAYLVALGVPAERLTAFRVARVVEAKPHPNADRLRVAQVEIEPGKPPVEVLTGIDLTVQSGEFLVTIVAQIYSEFYPGDRPRRVAVTKSRFQIAAPNSQFASFGVVRVERQLVLGN